MQQKRYIAKIVSIQEINTGEFVSVEGSPNFVKSNGKLIHRVNIMATVVSEPQQDPNLLSFFIDDSSGQLLVRVFDNFDRFSDVKVGDPVNIIGRPREFSGQPYLVPEVLKKITDPLWLKVRMNMLKDIKPPQIQQVVEEVVAKSSDSMQDILQIISELDAGAGADYEEVLNKVGSDSGEKLITTLIQEGEVFEFTPGKLKVLK